MSRYPLRLGDPALHVSGGVAVNVLSPPNRCQDSGNRQRASDHEGPYLRTEGSLAIAIQQWNEASRRGSTGSVGQSLEPLKHCRITLVVSLGSFQIGFQTARGNVRKAFTAEGDEHSGAIGAVGEFRGRRVIHETPPFVAVEARNL